MLCAKNFHANHVELIFQKYKLILIVFSTTTEAHYTSRPSLEMTSRNVRACLAFFVSQQPVVLGVKTAESHTGDGVVPPEEQSVQTQTLFRLHSHCALMCHLLLLYKKQKKQNELFKKTIPFLGRTVVSVIYRLLLSVRVIP